MTNGGNLEDAVKYALSKGVKPLLWYNSGGSHNQVSSGPRDRLTTPEARNKEFAWLKSIGIYGIKVDFFESDKQDMINYYIDILEDAAKYELLVNFHGSTVPRGWSRTYPHLVSMEAVYGAEQYNNQGLMTNQGAWHNTILPFTRNVIGPMDYTPVTFTNSQNRHSTTYAHELALPIIFESAIQHLADRPSGFDNLIDPAKDFLRNVPSAWDKTQLLDGYPGKSVVLARKRKNNWYVGGISGLDNPSSLKVNFSFLEKGKKYKVTILSDGDHDASFTTQYIVIDATQSLDIPCLPRGGFIMVLREL